MIPLKILTRACAQIIAERPERTQAVITRLSAILPRYGKVKRSAVMKRVVSRVARQLGIEMYRVVSADGLNAAEREQIGKNIGYGKYHITYAVNTQLLGGVIVKTQDKVLDLSLKNRIEKLKNGITAS